VLSCTVGVENVVCLDRLPRHQEARAFPDHSGEIFEIIGRGAFLQPLAILSYASKSWISNPQHLTGLIGLLRAWKPTASE